MVRIAVERVSDAEWRIVENGAVVLARCAFMKDADRIADALRQVGSGTTPLSEASGPTAQERERQDSPLDRATLLHLRSISPKIFGGYQVDLAGLLGEDDA